MEGLWTLETTWSPPGCAIRTDSSPVLPAEPGAPSGQRRKTSGSAAHAARVRSRRMREERMTNIVQHRPSAGIGGPKRKEELAADLEAHRGLGRADAPAFRAASIADSIRAICWAGVRRRFSISRVRSIPYRCAASIL